MSIANNKLGLLLINLGTPDAPTPTAIRSYLAEFLSDPCVIDLPQWLWQPILHSVILRTRPYKSAKLYQKIWSPQGSPLRHHSQQLASKLEKHLQRQGHAITVALGMRYGNPSIASAITMLQQQVKKIVVLPLYPQYSEASSGSSLHCSQRLLAHWQGECRFISDYHDHEAYISAISTHIEQHRRHQKLLFFFHGIPQQRINRGSPYQTHCLTTADLIAAQLELSPSQWMMAFQSRFGFARWLQPYAQQTLKNLIAQGIDEVDIICPGFAVDCLETLEEVAQGYQTFFQAHGGKSLNYIPALNDNPSHIESLAKIVVGSIKNEPSCSTCHS